MSFCPIRLHRPTGEKYRTPDGTSTPPTTPYPFVDILYDYQAFVKQPKIGTIPRGPEIPWVAVIGAGIAGLSAAYELMKVGVRPVIYEAATQEAGPSKGQPRVGGRCYSKPFYDQNGNDTGRFAEMGAMRMPVSARLFYHYAKLFGVEYSGDFPDPGKVPTILSYRGENYPWIPKPNKPYHGLPEIFHQVYDDWNTKVIENLTAPIAQNLQKGRLDLAKAQWQALIDQYEDKSFYQALTEIMAGWAYPDDYALFGALGIGSGGFGPLYQIGFLEMLRLMVNELETGQLSIVSGVSSLAEGFYSHVPAGGTPFGPVSLKDLGVLNAKRVTGVEALTSEGRVRVHCSDSSHQDFPVCIVAATTRSMQISMNMTSPAYKLEAGGWTKLYDPPINEDVQSVLRQLHMMNSSKLFILTRKKFWKNSNMPQNIQTDQLPCGVYMLDYGSGDEYGVVAVSYTWGDDSSKLLGELSPMERLQTLTAAIASIDVDVANNIDWEAQDLYYGAFKLNYPGQGHLAQRAYYQFQECLDETSDQRIFLAGDSVSWVGGWIEGALHTGLNAAAAVIHKLGGKFAIPSPLTQDPNAYTYKGTSSG